MLEYMIHTYPNRLWYVEKHLVPSMLEQGIDSQSIIVWNDANREGNLISCMKAFRGMLDKGETWHLQDDVIISSDFAKKSKTQPEGIVCGFCSDVCKQWGDGIQSVDKMWYSFPCIKIPNEIARECAEWFYNEASKAGKYRYWVEAKKFDDSFFREFLIHKHSHDKVLNLKPNIVNHIDYLLGGSIVNKGLIGNRMSVYWYEPELINNLMESLKK